MDMYYCNSVGLNVRFRTITASATTIARTADASARCASLIMGLSEVVTVTIPRNTCAISATRLAVDKRTIFLASLCLVQATIANPKMNTPTTELKSRCVSSITTSGLFSEGRTAPLHKGQDSPQPRPELLVVTYPPMTIRM